MILPKMPCVLAFICLIAIASHANADDNSPMRSTPSTNHSPRITLSSEQIVQSVQQAVAQSQIGESSNPIRGKAQLLRNYPRGLYFLTFGADGQLIDTTELNRAYLDVRVGHEEEETENGQKKKIVKRWDAKKILILSVGWGNNHVESVQTYTDYLNRYYNGRTTKEMEDLDDERRTKFLKISNQMNISQPLDLQNLQKPTEQQLTEEILAATEPIDGVIREGKKRLDGWVVFCVSWDSNMTAVTHALNDLLPTPTLLSNVGKIIDYPMFPFTYWSKSSQADRIGYGSLKDTLEWFIDNTFFDQKSPKIYLIGHSFGARILSGLSQKASSPVELKETDEEFKYTDKIQGAVFLLPALTRENIPDAKEYPIFIVQSRHDHANGFLYPFANTLLNSYPGTMMERSYRYSRLTGLQQLGADILRIPGSLVVSMGTLPFRYLYAQAHELLNRGFRYIPDTLAQLPIIEIPVWALNRRLDPKGQWGQAHKGLFNLGIWAESAGRLETPMASKFYFESPMTLDESLGKLSQESSETWKGQVFVNGAKYINNNVWGESNLETPWRDFTLGWIDPIAGHIDYTHDCVLSLIEFVLHIEDAHVVPGNPLGFKKCSLSSR